MERQELEQMLRRVDGEAAVARRQLAALQERVDGLTQMAQGLRKLLGVPPPAQGPPPTALFAAGTAAMNGHAPADADGKTPTGMGAVKQILVSDPGQSWSIQMAWEDARKRGWNLSRDAVRIGFVRLYDHEPENIERTKDPVTAYRWRAELPAGS